MKALILAAGLGTRLAPITDKVPKALVPVNREPIIHKQIQNLVNNGIKDIFVVVGYKNEILQKYLNENFSFVTIINNKDYNTTNNMYSAYLGKAYVAHDDFLMMNADVFFDEIIISELIKDKYCNAIVTDIGSYSEESMKVVEKDGRIVAISKQIEKSQALGNSIDVYKFSSEAGQIFFEQCEEYIEKNHDLKKWSEVALNDILTKCVFKKCPLVGRWFEIDNHEDLAQASKLFLK